MTDKRRPTTEDLAREMRALIDKTRTALGMSDQYEEATRAAQATTETEQLIERLKRGAK